MDETVQTTDDEVLPNQKIFADDIEQFAVEPILDMPTYEGEVDISHQKVNGEIEHIPLRVRIIVGADVPLPTAQADGSYSQASDAITALFNEATSRLVDNAIGFSDAWPPDNSARLAFGTMADKARENPNVPVTLIYAHGHNMGSGFHFLLREGLESQVTMDAEEFIRAIHDKRLLELQDVIAAIKERDGLGKGDPNHLVVLASCNQTEAQITSNATIISRAGIVGALSATGHIQVYDPATGETRRALSALENRSESN